MQLDRMVEARSSDGKATEMKAFRYGETYTLNGANSSKVIGGYGITRNIPGDFFDAWLEQNKDLALVRNNLVFKQPSLDQAEDQAEEQADLKSGMEGIDPKKPGKGLTPASDKPNEE
jgi:hypothetical protein